MSPRIRIEDTLASGEKITITLEGRRLSRQRIMQVLEMIELVEYNVERGDRSSKLKETIWNAVIECFSGGKWFTSRDLKEALEENGVNIKQSTLSTYLLRFFKCGLLERREEGKGMLEYRVKADTRPLGP